MPRCGTARGARRRAALAVPLVLLAAAAPARAQEAPPPPPPPPGFTVSSSFEAALDAARARGRRPVVGLALSGGGARGLAHIGALAALEAMGIPVDRVAGTSMGAVIGGLYASGYSPAEIERIAAGLDWRQLFSDLPSRRSLSPLQKERFRRTLFEFGIEGGRVAGGGGLIAGQRLTTLFATLTLHVSDRERFADLPVPFACVATDVATGEEVVLDSAPLHQAMRASMSIPLVFSPVERAGRRLIDGGLSNNLPVDRARGLGADVVIAVDVSEPLLPPERLGSILGIAQQVLAYRIVANRNRQAPAADLLIVPDLAPHDQSDFSEVADLAGRGRRAVEAAAGALARLAEACRLPDPPGAVAPRPAAPDPGGRGRGPVIDRVVIEGGSRLKPGAMEGWARVEAGRPLEAAALERQIESIYATGYFNSVHPSIEPLPGGGHLLRLRLREKRALQLGVGLRYEDERGPALLLTLGRINFFGRDNSAHLDARAGTVSRLDFHFLQPSYPSTSFFTSLRVSGVDDFRFVYGPGRERDRYLDRRAVVELAAGNTVRALGEVSLAYRLERVNFRAEEDPQSGPVGQEFARLGMLGLGTRLDTLDDPSFPTRGRRMEIRFDSARDGLASQAKFDRGRLAYDGYRPLGAGTAHFGMRLGTAFGGGLPESEKLLLGGPESLYGLERAERRGDEMAAVRLGWRLPLGTLPLIGGGRYYLGAMLDAGNVALERRDLDRGTVLGLGIELAADTRLGPLRLAGGWAEGGLETVYVNLGFPF